MNTLVFYEDHRGKSPAIDFLDSLPPKEKAKAFYVLKLLEEFGTDLRLPHARHLEGKLWELRPGANRLLYFVHVGNQIVILHGFRKKTNKTPRREINTALRRMQEILQE